MVVREDYDNMYTTPKWYFPRRFNIVFLSFFTITLAYMMRANLSIAILDMAHDFNWKASNKGLYLSSFFWGYITTQLIGGMAARKFGPKAMMLFVVIVPSCFTLLIPLVAAKSEMLFIACRVLTGVAAGATFPTAYLQLAGWVPFNEKALTISVVFSGVNVGTIIIDVVGPVIMKHLGWQYVFYISGSVGFIWVILWAITATSTPAEMKFIHPNEVRYIQDKLTAPDTETTPILKSVQVVEEEGLIKSSPKALMESKEALTVLFSNSSFWNIVICAFCTNFGSYIFLTWLPTYVNSQLHFDVQSSGIIAIAPSISGAIIGFISGKVCDVLVKRGYRLLIVRKVFFFLGCVFYIVTLVLLAYKDLIGLTNIQAAAILAVGSGGGGFHIPGLSANIYDIAPHHPSLVVGISNTAGTIPGIVGVFVTGVLLEHGMSWGSIWLMVASFYATAMVINFIFCNVKRVV